MADNRITKERLENARKYRKRYDSKLENLTNNYKKAEIDLKSAEVRSTHINPLLKPHELHYYKERVYDSETGKAKYKRSLRLEESYRRQQMPKGALHKLNYISQNRVHSEGSQIVSEVKRTVMKTGLAAESTLLSAKKISRQLLESELNGKLQSQAQDDASKGGVMAADLSQTALVGSSKHFYNKAKNHPYTQKTKKRKAFLADKKKLEKIQRKAYKKAHKLDSKYNKHHKRHLDIDSSVKPVKKYKPKGIDKKIAKTQNKINTYDSKLDAVRNKSLRRKAAENLRTRAESSLKNKIRRDSGENNDAVRAAMLAAGASGKAVDKFTSPERFSNKKKKQEKKKNKLHKKSANQRFKAKEARFDSKNSSNNKRKSGNKSQKKKEKKSEHKSRKIVLIIILFLLPLLMIPMLFTACAGIFGNESTFSYVTGTYSADYHDLSSAAQYYENLITKLNDAVLDIPNNWKKYSGVYNPYSDYKIDYKAGDDPPTRFVYGNNGYLSADSTLDFDKHKLYAFLCAYLYDRQYITTNPYLNLDRYAMPKWEYSTSIEAILTKLFDIEYELVSRYYNNAYWQARGNYDFAGYYSYDGCYYDYATGLGYCKIVHPDALPFDRSYLDDNDNLYFSLTNGEICNSSNNYSATGWYLQDQYITIIDSSGNNYEGWYDGQKCNFGVYNNEVHADFKYVIHDENWVSFLHIYDRINESTLFYSVNRKRSFDEIAKEVLDHVENKVNLYEYYQLLLGLDDKKLYGLLQVGVSPVYQGYHSLLSCGYILEDFWGDVRNWNSKHCYLPTHNGMSIIQNSGNDVYAMFSGKIIDVGDNFVVLQENYNKESNRSRLMVLYSNISPSVTNGQYVSAGAVIGKTNSRKKEGSISCDGETLDISQTDSNIGIDYLNIVILEELSHTSSKWAVIDPSLVICLSDYKGE